MGWQTPGEDGPDPNDQGATTPPPHVAPELEPDAETARVPVDQGADPVPPPPPTAGLISAKPVGWTDPNASPASESGTADPAVAWVPPVRTAAPVVDGLVISTTFSRLVAYSIDILFLGLLNLSVLGALGLFDRGRDSSLDLVVGVAFVGVDCL
jgi:hypothetical protein